MNMKRRKDYLLLVLMLVLLLCTGCDGSSNDQESEAVYGTEDSETEKILLQPNQWQQGFLEMSSMSKQEKPYYDMRRRDIQLPEIDFSYDERKDISAYAWDARYVLMSVRVQGNERYILSRQTSDLTESEQVEILNDWESIVHGYAVYMDIVKEDMIAVLFAESSFGWQSQITGYDLLMLNSEGRLLSAQSLTDAYQELGISIDMGISVWCCDAEGYQYLLLDQGTRLIIIDSQGMLARDKILVPEEELFETAFHMPDGNLVFSKSVFSKAGTELIWMEFPGGTEHVLWECSGISMNQFTVTPEGAVMTLATAVDLWQKDSWTIQDILEIVDNNELEGMFYNSLGESDPELNLFYFFDGASGDVPFCDMERGESHFESEEFQRLLEVCKRYGEKKNGSKENILNLMAGGKILAMDQFYSDMSEYAKFRAEYDGRVHFVGYPEQAEGVGIFSSCYYVVVNKNAKNMEVIAEFLNYLLSSEAQSNVNLSVVSIAALDDIVVYYEGSSGEIWCEIKTGRGVRKVELKEDGSSYMPDYIDFMNQLGVYQVRDEIWEIVEQEAEDYWNGSKSAEDVALVIDNRVQLYLDEHR